MPRYVNKVELSELVGISERSLTEWQKEGMPIHKRADERGQANEYEVAAVVQWMIQRELARAQVRSPRDELDRVKTLREQIALQKDLGELVEIGQVRPLLDRYVADVGSLIDNMPDEMAPIMQQIPDLEGKHQALKEAARKIRQGLGDYEFCCQADPGGDPGV